MIVMSDKKLKTLKNLEHIFTPWLDSDNEVEVHVAIKDGIASICISDDLRDVAWEWIKELENYYLGGYTFGDKWYSSDEGIDLAMGWIKYFFNLEDEND